MQASRAFRFVALLVAATAAGAASAATPALVIDAESGKVLYAERATDPWYPASITKLMTAYVALSAVRAGRITLDTPLTVSELAQSMPPSKMGFPPGIEITLDNALKIIMVKSANDVATTIAEGVGGSVEGFADMMNAAAQRLGMRESRFVNPHGLPDERQHTSARDMAILGRALFREFPEHAGYFSIGAIKFGKRVMNNHNGLMGRYPGADGLKTGFICASGFNVVASATRNGRRLITVVMGSPSAAERTIKAAALFDHGFNTWGWASPTVEQLPPSNLVNAPNMRPVICERRGPPPGESDGPSPGEQAGTITGDADGGRIQLPSSALAFSAIGTPGARPQLGPRMRFEPIRVWTGRTPPTAMAADDQDEEKPAKAAAKPRAKPPTRAASAPHAPAAAQASAEPKPILDDGKGNKGAIQPNASASPKPAAAPRPNAGAIAAKPKPAQSAAADSPAANKPAAAAKPPVAPKPAAAAPAVKASPAAPKPAAGAKAEAKPTEAKPAAAKPAEKKSQVAADAKATKKAE
jgi:D-alanyl-D-alanine carboxypeptidase